MGSAKNCQNWETAVEMCILGVFLSLKRLPNNNNNKPFQKLYTPRTPTSDAQIIYTPLGMFIWEFTNIHTGFRPHGLGVTVTVILQTDPVPRGGRRRLHRRRPSPPHPRNAGGRGVSVRWDPRLPHPGERPLRQPPKVQPPQPCPRTHRPPYLHELLQARSGRLGCCA